MDPTTIHIANIGTDMPTNLTTVQLYMNSMAIRIVNLGADMLTNPIGCSIVHKNAWILWQITLQTLAQTCLQTLSVVQLHERCMDSTTILQTLAQTMHGFYGNSHGKPWHRHAYKPYSCSITCKNNLMHRFYGNSHGKPWHRRAYKPYSCSIEMHGFYNNSHGKPWHRHAYKPYSCSITRKNAWILQQSLQILAHTCLQTLSVVQLYIEMHRFYGNSHGKNAWILWQLPWQTLAQTCLQTLQLFNCT